MIERSLQSRLQIDSFRVEPVESSVCCIEDFELLSWIARRLESKEVEFSHSDSVTLACESLKQISPRYEKGMDSMDKRMVHGFPIFTGLAPRIT